MGEYQILHEITPLQGKDGIYIVERHKKEFDYPVHRHECAELNFVENAAGARRIVGDSNEVIGDFDLALITSYELEHAWEQGACHSDDIREITIQFDFGFGEGSFFDHAPFRTIYNMLRRAKKGLAFPKNDIAKVYDKLDTIAKLQDPFRATMQLIEILHSLSLSEKAYTLATTSYAKVRVQDDSKRVLKVKEYISHNYQHEIKLKDVAALANMSRTSFSRFFRQHTGRTLSGYITDIRMGYATRMLVDSEESISEICFLCGYNNMSNFNRTFRRLKGCTPGEYRAQYKKIKVLI